MAQNTTFAEALFCAWHLVGFVHFKSLDKVFFSFKPKFPLFVTETNSCPHILFFCFRSRTLNWIYAHSYQIRSQHLEEGMAPHSSILVWRIPWIEEPGGLQSRGLQRVGHDWSSGGACARTHTHTHTRTHTHAHTHTHTHTYRIPRCGDMTQVWWMRSITRELYKVLKKAL